MIVRTQESPRPLVPTRFVPVEVSHEVKTCFPDFARVIGDRREDIEQVLDIRVLQHCNDPSSFPKHGVVRIDIHRRSDDPSHRGMILDPGDKGSRGWVPTW